MSTSCTAPKLHSHPLGGAITLHGITLQCRSDRIIILMNIICSTMIAWSFIARLAYHKSLTWWIQHSLTKSVKTVKKSCHRPTLAVLCLRRGLCSRRCGHWQTGWSSVSPPPSLSPSAPRGSVSLWGKASQLLQEHSGSEVAAPGLAWAQRRCSDLADKTPGPRCPAGGQGLGSASLESHPLSYWQLRSPCPAWHPASPPSPSATGPPVGSGSQLPIVWGTRMWQRRGPLPPVSLGANAFGALYGELSFFFNGGQAAYWHSAVINTDIQSNYDSVNVSVKYNTPGVLENTTLW